MSEFFRSKKWIVFFLLIVLLFSAVSIYVFLNIRLHEEAASKKIDFQTSQTYLENLHNDNKNAAKEDETYLATLIEKVPQNPNVDDYILSLQSIFEKNKSKINDVEFLYDGTVSDWQKNDISSETQNENPDANPIDEYETDIEELAEDKRNSVEQTNDSPEGLEILIVRMSTVSPNYHTFVSLIDTLENQQRKSVVKSFSYQTNDNKQISSQIELLTFYYPSN